ncbi:VF530 family protein [Aquabacterium sp. A7-Y]|uniref:VF530 family protein n=1 Tax=Aquabacterium sp. A7-Y TaxID=1349605 RepID=UPI00223E3711|nr:VF530 family protein [Aquabacterium sp. A7-Y]MCW7536881.1 VF530 family protein [Aquabacterium sp. A7-Y]
MMRGMHPAVSKDPLHGKTLEQILTELVAFFGWPGLGRRIAIRCFTSDPSVRSSLQFLRRTPWARTKVESLYLFMLREQARQAAAAPRRPPDGDLPP